MGGEEQDGVSFISVIFFACNLYVRRGSFSFFSRERFLIWWNRVYGVLRDELWGEALRKFQRISYVHSKQVARPSRIKL